MATQPVSLSTSIHQAQIPGSSFWTTAARLLLSSKTSSGPALLPKQNPNSQVHFSPLLPLQMSILCNQANWSVHSIYSSPVLAVILFLHLCAWFAILDLTHLWELTSKSLLSRTFPDPPQLKVIYTLEWQLFIHSSLHHPSPWITIAWISLIFSDGLKILKEKILECLTLYHTFAFFQVISQ